MAAGNIDRLNIGPIETFKLSWDQPHEGNLFDHLYRQRAFQMKTYTEEERQFTSCVTDLGGMARLPIVYALSKGTPYWAAFKAGVREAGRRGR